jgi:hypothetical protein
MVQREVVEVAFKVFWAVYCHCGVGKSGSKNEGKHFLLELGMMVFLNKGSLFLQKCSLPYQFPSCPDQYRCSAF